MKKIAVLMTVHNRREKTLKCLECLYACPIPSGYSLDVYMTDDGCTDGTPDSVSEEYPSVHILKGDGTLYWNRGMWNAWNEAAKEDYDYYLWLNDDTYLYQNAVSSLISTSDDYDSQAIVVGATENSDHTSLTYGGRINRKIPHTSGTPVEVEYFNGNVVMVPRHVFHQLGNLDYHFRHSKGDFDYGFRARKTGIKMIQAGEVVGVCDIHANIDKWCDPQISFEERWKAMWSPTGMSPVEFFYFDKKHKGCGSAFIHFFSIISRCVFPSLWLRHKL